MISLEQNFLIYGDVDMRTKKMSREEKVICDVKDCSNESPIEHNVNFPIGWTMLFDSERPKDYHLCPSCKQKIRDLLKK